MFSFFKDDLAIDLFIDMGTANTIISAKDKGVVMNEPSVVAYSEISPGKRRIVAVGLDAKEKVARTPGNLTQAKPLKQSVISDFDITETMLSYYLSRPEVLKCSKKPTTVMSIPMNVSDVEKEALIEAAQKAGARKVHLVEETLVAAVGAGIDIMQAKGSMLIDIGGGTTEIVIIALTDIVFGKTIRVGGYKMDEAIVQYMKEKKRLIINEQTAENLKMENGTACPKKDIRSCQVTGRDVDSGLTKTIEVTSDEVGQAMDSCIQEIINEIHQSLENTPPELVSDIIESGIILTGGGALVRDIDFRIENEIRLPVKVARSPLTSTAQGGEVIMKNRELLEKLIIEI